MNWSLEVAETPQAALARLELAINLPRRRALGLFKLRPEFVGWIEGSEFEIWERQGRAIHASGRARGRRDGTLLEARLSLSRLARRVACVFFPLYVLVGIGIATQPPDPQLSAGDAVIIIVGGLTLGAIFYDSIRRQRRDLLRFLGAVFREDGA